jgi:hypothetical protein
MIAQKIQTELPKPPVQTMGFCKNCQRETPHEIRGGKGCAVKLCIPCVQRTMMYDEYQA